MRTRKTKKTLGKELNCEFIRTNPAKEKFDIFVEIGKNQNYIVKSTRKMPEESTKKSVEDELSNTLLRLVFKSDNSIETKCLEYVVKKILPTL